VIYENKNFPGLGTHSLLVALMQRLWDCEDDKLRLVANKYAAVPRLS
jgi:hypothetical protein